MQTRDGRPASPPSRRPRVRLRCSLRPRLPARQPSFALPPSITFALSALLLFFSTPLLLLLPLLRPSPPFSPVARSSSFPHLFSCSRARTQSPCATTMADHPHRDYPQDPYNHPDEQYYHHEGRRMYEEYRAHPPDAYAPPPHPAAKTEEDLYATGASGPTVSSPSVRDDDGASVMHPERLPPYTGFRAVYYHPVIQVFFLGFVCFMGPGLFNALNGLGGGGMVDATTSANANSTLYATFAVAAFFAG